MNNSEVSKLKRMTILGKFVGAIATAVVAMVSLWGTTDNSAKVEVTYEALSSKVNKLSEEVSYLRGRLDSAASMASLGGAGGIPSAPASPTKKRKKPVVQNAAAPASMGELVAFEGETEVTVEIDAQQLEIGAYERLPRLKDLMQRIKK